MSSTPARAVHPDDLPSPVNLLIVDESETDRATYIRYLRSAEEEYRILEADSIETGLALWRSGKPEIAILDWWLPDGEGADFLDAIRADRPEGQLPVVVITGRGDERTAVRAMKSGAADYEMKGELTARALVASVRRARERDRLTRELVRSRQQAAAIADIALQIRQSLDLETILKTAVERVRSVLECDRVNIWLFETDGKITAVAESTNSSRSLVGEQIEDPRFDNDRSEIYRRGEIRVISDIHAASMSDCHRELLLRLGTRAKIFAPLVCDGELWGFLGATESDRPRDWRTEEVELLRSLSVQLAIALQQAIAHRQLQTELNARRETEARLRESERRYASLVEASPVGIFRTDAAGKCLYVNDRCCQIGGFDVNSSLGDGWQKSLHPDDRDRVFREWERAVRENRPFCLEYRLLHEDGTVVWVYGQTVAERDDRGEVVGYAGTITDISDRARAETALRESEARFRHLADTAPVMIWMADTSKLCNYFNKTWLDFTGRSIEREIGDGWAAGVHADDLRRCLETYLDSFECRVEFRMEYRLQRHDGEYRWLLDRGVPRFTAEGEFLGYIGSCIDIDDRVRAERQLQNLIEGTSSTTGKDFFPALVHHLAAALDVAHAGVGELIDGRLNILAFQSRGVAVSLDPRPIVNTPTERTVRYGRFYLESGLREEFPEAAAPVDANSYLGIALQDSRGQAIGALCLFDGEPIRSDRRAEQLLRAFAARASAELEREKATRALQKMNRDLEREVEERTAASRASEERLRLVLEGANDGFWDWDVPTGRVFVSDRWKRMRGLENEDLENPLETWSNSLHQEDRERVMKAIDDHFAGKTRFFESEYRVRHRDGSYFWVLDRGRAVRDESGRAVRMSGSGTDIDALKRAEERLVNLSDRLQLALQAGAIGTWEWDLGQNLNWDDRMLEIYGLQGLDRPVTYQDWRERVHPDDLASIEDALAETLRERQNFDREFRAYRADGELRWVHSIALVQRDPRGKPLRAIGINYDITERKRAEENLARYAREVEDLYNNAPCGYHSLDPEGRYIRVNETELQWLGYCREEMIGRPIADFLTATGRQFFEENYRAFQERGWVQNLEYEMICKDGSILPVTAGATAVKDADGNYLYNRATLVDNRERSAAERVIRQQAERESLLRQITQRIRESLDLRTIFDTACREIREVLKADRVGIFRFSPESNFVDGQFVAESVVAGFPSVLSLVVRDHCFGDNYSSLYERGRFYVIDDIYRGDLASCHTNILTRFRVRANMVMPLLRAGRLWGLLCVHQCANVRHWQSFEIDLTRQLADQLAIAIQQVDLYDRLQGELRERQQAQQELTRRNQQLAISNEELARATRLKDEFLANMSHELRTPLNAILGMAEGLQEGVFGTLVPEQLRALRTIERSGSHLLELINDILDVAKIEAGQLELDLAPTAVMPLCRSSLAFIKQQALKKGVRLEVKLPPELPDLLIDERRARQVLINLLNNAVKFTPSGGCVTLEIGRPSVRAPLEPPPLQGITKVRVYRSPLEQELGLPLPEENRSGGEYVPISIIDTGIGIPPEYLDKLFQPFIQIDSSLNRQYTGTGLGLALVKRLVELHGGQVRVTSQPGSGSRFTIELPIVTASLPTRTRSNARPEPEAPEAGEPEFEIEAAAGDGKLAHPTVLLAEDNDANVMTISAYLQARGYRVLVAGNGREAVTLNRSACPDLILMDIQMPEMDGLEAIRRIHGHAGRNAPPIVALTALAMPEDRERCLNAGADAYLSKPVKLKELAIEIDRLLAARSDEG